MVKRYVYWWLSFLVGYIFPFVYFFIKVGITKTATSIVMPVIILGIFAILKLCTAIPAWIATWRPSVVKGLIKSIPIYLLFICLVTFGLVFKYMLEHQIELAFGAYFEVVFIIFGSLCLSSILGAYHQKYKELDLLSKGYTLGVVNNVK